MLARQFLMAKKFSTIVGGKMTDAQIYVTALFMLFVIVGILE